MAGRRPGGAEAHADNFVRDDGVALRVVPGFRRHVLGAPRVSVQPKPEWGAADYEAATDKKLRGVRRVVRELEQWGGSLEGASVLEIGCGAGIDSLLLAMHPVHRVVGIDRDLPVNEPGDRGRRTRRLMQSVLDRSELSGEMDAVFARLPVELRTMDATRMDFADASFDVLVSRAALEHIAPIDRAIAEMARVVRPGGLVRHGIDQFYWLRGCHKGGLVDVPWAHARLGADDYRRFVAETEGEAVADRRSRHLASLNQLNLRQWHTVFEASPFEILDWKEEPSPLAEALLEDHPEVRETVVDGVTPADLVHASIKVWLRKPAERPSG